MHTNNRASFFKRAEEMANLIESNRDSLIAELSKYETFDAANDEVDRSIDALRGVKEEFNGLKANADDLVMCTFFPLNLPLYSLILFAIIPGAFTEKVYVRAPEIMQDIMANLNRILGIEKAFPQISIKRINRSAFLDLYAKRSDVILFTGRYENAIAVQKECPGALFIFNGGGVNPAVVYADAEIEIAVDKIFEMRTFNSGQDCAGTDAVFVHESRVEEFLCLLTQKVKAAKVGEYSDSSTQIGPILKKEYVENLYNYLLTQEKHIVLKGEIDKNQSIVHPSIIVKSAKDHVGGFHEFFAPVFYVLTFQNEQEIDLRLSEKAISDYSMYITYFSAKDRLTDFTSARILKNHIINDVEQGNSEYGGYGEKANFVAFGSNRICRPILISREIDQFYASDRLA